MSKVLRRVYETNSNENSVHINPYRLLPSKYIIPDSGTHLYRIGLLNIPTNNSVRYKSSKYQKYYRYINSTVLLIFFLRCFVSLFQSDDNKQIFKYIGDISAFIPGIRIHFNVMLITVMLISLISQYLHWNQTTYSWLKPFKMLSGEVMPISIGFTDEIHIRKLYKRSKILFLITNTTINVFFPISISILLPYIIITNYSLIEFIFLGIPWLALSLIVGVVVCRILFWQFIYFHIICIYLRLNIRQVNNKIIDLLRLKNSKKDNRRPIGEIIHDFTDILTEINEYNHEFWSKFILLVTTVFVVIICAYLYQIIFGVMDIILRLVFIYLSLTTITIFFFFILSAASVTTEEKRSYHLMYKFFNKMNLESTKFLINLKMKVNKS
jgi:hypothetical protein